MTPVIWATAEKLEQRELIGKLFYTLKELGVVLCTVEEHAKPGETIGEDVLLPIYLSDGAIHLQYYPVAARSTAPSSCSRCAARTMARACTRTCSPAASASSSARVRPTSPTSRAGAMRRPSRKPSARPRR